MKRILLFGILFLLSNNVVFSQDYTWWNELHNWDGVSPWKSYITYSAKYMGPNSLPVPYINSGNFPDRTEFYTGLQYHFSEGDKTFNFLSDLFLPVAPGRAGLMIHYIPFEYYQTDSATRDQRAARDYNTYGHSFGDVYFTSFFQLIKDHDKLPDLLFTVNIKTASGTNLGSARNTDTPAYYFDISLGKSFPVSVFKNLSLRPYMNGGFYSYQTNRTDYMQNDAVMFGFGLKASSSVFEIENQIGGYLGYFGNGDQPVVYRLNLKTNTVQGWNFKLQFQAGIHDVNYNSISFSTFFRFQELHFPLFRPENNALRMDI